MSSLVYIISGILVAAIGLVSVFYGAKIYKFLLPVLGAIVGLGLGAGLLSVFSAPTVLVWIGAIVLGVIGALLSAFLWKFSVLLQFYSGTYFLVTWLLSLIGLSTNGTFGFVAVLIGAVIGFIIVLAAWMTQAWNYLIAIGTAFYGAVLTMYGVGAIFYDESFLRLVQGEASAQDLGIQSWVLIIGLLLGVALAGLGSYFQISTDNDIQDSVAALKEVRRSVQ